MYVDAATAYSPYIPGAIRYSVNSVPEILDELQNRAYQKLANFIEYTGLVRVLALSVPVPEDVKVIIFQTADDPVRRRRTLLMPGSLILSGELSIPPSLAWLCAWPSTTLPPTTPMVRSRAGEDCHPLLWEVPGPGTTQSSSLLQSECA